MLKYLHCLVSCIRVMYFSLGKEQQLNKSQLPHCVAVAWDNLLTAIPFADETQKGREKPFVYVCETKDEDSKEWSAS